MIWSLSIIAIYFELLWSCLIILSSSSSFSFLFTIRQEPHSQDERGRYSERERIKNYVQSAWLGWVTIYTFVKVYPHWPLNFLWLRKVTRHSKFYSKFRNPLALICDVLSSTVVLSLDTGQRRRLIQRMRWEMVSIMLTTANYGGCPSTYPRPDPYTRLWLRICDFKDYIISTGFICSNDLRVKIKWYACCNKWVIWVMNERMFDTP